MKTPRLPDNKATEPAPTDPSLHTNKGVILNQPGEAARNRTRGRLPRESPVRWEGNRNSLVPGRRDFLLVQQGGKSYNRIQVSLNFRGITYEIS